MNEAFPVASVYRARPDENGELSAWETMTSLPSARAYHDMRTFGGFLYAVGGDTATVDPNNGEFGNNDSKLDEVVYVPINLRNGDLDATDWTINANSLSLKRSKHSMLVAGGANLFNQAALSYVDANGVAHVVVIGGDNVNLQGVKRSAVMFY